MELIAKHAILLAILAQDLCRQTASDAQFLSISLTENVFLVPLRLFLLHQITHSVSAAPLVQLLNTSTTMAAVLILVILASILSLTNSENSANLLAQPAVLFTLIPLVTTILAFTHLSKSITVPTKSANTFARPAKWPSNLTPPVSHRPLATLLMRSSHMELTSLVTLLVLQRLPLYTLIGIFLV